MPKNTLTFIDQESVRKDFDEHLIDESNKRILFSARFGAGKSTFLNDFFEKNGDKYIPLKLYPVNYSIAHNKDVFELIKYDLIYELLAKYPDDINLQKEDYSMALIGQMFILHNLRIDPLLKSILKAIKPGSDDVTNIVDELASISKAFKSYNENISTDESDLLLKYIKNLKSFKGSAHEYDEISELISNMLERIKTSSDNSKKKIVLIIDDLDRLDPEHVFRLFNIFSAHYDSITQENKFGFDKVIFVCDYDNIRLMYEHRYGRGVDFSGYIDKFFSTDVFQYENKKYVLNVLEKIFKEKPQNIPQKLVRDYSVVHSPLYKSFEYILLSLLETNAISLRNLEQFNSYDIPIFKIKAGERKYNYDASNFPFLVLIHLLEKLLSKSELMEYFELLSNRFYSTSGNLNNIDYSENAERNLVEFTLPFILDQNIIFNTNRISSEEETGAKVVNKQRFEYTISKDSVSGYRHVELILITEDDIPYTPIKRPNPFSFLLAALEKSESLVKVR